MYIRQAPSGMYHVRIRVPADAQPLLRRAELHCSLGTANRREAEHRARPIISRMRAQIFKAKAQANGDTYRSELLRAQADALGVFDAIDDHYLSTHRTNTIEQLQAFMAQLAQPVSAPPAEPARTVLNALSPLTPLTELLDHNETIDLTPATLLQRRRSYADFMGHVHSEALYYLEHVTPDHWQSWCRALHEEPLTHSTMAIKMSCARSVIKDFLISSGRTFDASAWASIKVGKTPQSELKSRREANSPLTLERWQHIHDHMLDANRHDEADIWSLGLLTGARIDEIIHVHASHLDLTRREWRIPFAKSIAGVRMIPLTPMALDIISDRLSTSTDGYLFERRPSHDKSYRFWFNKCAKARRAAGAIPKVETQHSTRSTFRTLSPRMAPASTPAGVIEAIMGHELGGSIASATKHYLRAFEEDAHTFMAHWRPDITLRRTPS